MTKVYIADTTQNYFFLVHIAYIVYPYSQVMEMSQMINI